MDFGGLQKLTLLDFPGTVACTVFTVGCNYRCPFCHNAALVSHPADLERISEESVLAFLKKRAGVLEGVAVTGGEPLLRRELPDFLTKVKGLGLKVKLDTNGSFPDRLADCIRMGIVDYVAMDIKNCREKYALTAGSAEALPKVERSMALLKTGPVPYELRTTVVRGLHTPADIAALARWIAPVPKYYLQNFVDSGDILQPGFTGFKPAELEVLLAAAKAALPEAALRGA